MKSIILGSKIYVPVRRPQKFNSQRSTITIWFILQWPTLSERVVAEKFHIHYRSLCQAVIIVCTIISRLDYGNSLLIDLPVTHFQRLQSVQNAAARLIFNVRRCDHITDVLINLHWLCRIRGGDADVSCTAWFHTTLLGVVIHMCRRHAAPTQAQVCLHWTTWRSDLSSVNCRRSCLSCCWSKGVEWPAKWGYVGLVTVGVQEQAEDILVSLLLRNCLIWMTFPFPSHYLSSRTVVLAIVFTV